MIDVNPMLAETGSEADLDNPRFAAELKADGMRVWLVKLDDKIEIFGRPRDEGIVSDYTKKLPEVIEDAGSLPGRDFIIDGEAVVCDKGGRTWFEGSQRRCGVESPVKIREYRWKYPITILAFDLLLLDGKQMQNHDYETRKMVLQDILHTQPIHGSIQFLPHVVENKREFYKRAIDLGEEGLILKLLGSRYEEGRRSKSWLKVKRWYEERVRVVGYTPGEGKRRDVFGSLILAKADGGVLRYVGKVGSGFNDRELREVSKILFAAQSMPQIEARDADGHPVEYTPVKADVEVTVKFGEVSKNGVYRFPSLVKDRLGNNQIHFGKTLAAKPKATDLSDMLKELVK